MDTSINITRRRALQMFPAITVTVASSAAIAAVESSQEKILRLTEELQQALVEQQGGDWIAHSALDVGMVMFMAKD